MTHRSTLFGREVGLAGLLRTASTACGVTVTLAVAACGASTPATAGSQAAASSSSSSSGTSTSTPGSSVVAAAPTASVPPPTPSATAGANELTLSGGVTRNFTSPIVKCQSPSQLFGWVTTVKGTDSDGTTYLAQVQVNPWSGPGTFDLTSNDGAINLILSIQTASGGQLAHERSTDGTVTVNPSSSGSFATDAVDDGVGTTYGPVHVAGHWSCS